MGIKLRPVLPTQTAPDDLIIAICRGEALEQQFYPERESTARVWDRLCSHVRFGPLTCKLFVARDFEKLCNPDHGRCTLPLILHAYDKYVAKQGGYFRSVVGTTPPDFSKIVESLITNAPTRWSDPISGDTPRDWSGYVKAAAFNAARNLWRSAPRITSSGKKGVLILKPKGKRGAAYGQTGKLYFLLSRSHTRVLISAILDRCEELLFTRVANTHWKDFTAPSRDRQLRIFKLLREEKFHKGILPDIAQRLGVPPGLVKNDWKSLKRYLKRCAKTDKSLAGLLATLRDHETDYLGNLKVPAILSIYGEDVDDQKA